MCNHCNCNTRWFWKISKIHFCFLYQTWGFDPFHNRFVGKKMWGSPTQKRFRKKINNLNVWTFTSLRSHTMSDSSTNMTGLDVSWSKTVHKIWEQKNNTGNETRKGLKLRFTMIHPTPQTFVKGVRVSFHWQNLSKKTNAHSNL